MSKYSDEARKLFPYMLPMIERAGARIATTNGGGGGGGGGGGTLTSHALNSATHTGTLGNAQGPQFLLVDGTRDLTGHLDVAVGITIDGVDLSVHVADPNAHHDTATAGDGIVLTGQQIFVDLATNSGLEFSSGDLRIDEDADFLWTNTHQFNLDPQINANLDFIGDDRSITASSDLTLAPADDLILPSDTTFRSSDYADGIPIFGFSIFDPGGSGHINRQLTINSIKTDEFHTRLFVADTVRIDIGEEYWGKSMGIVHTDFTTPGSIGGTVTALFEDSPLITGALFSNNDWILIRYLDDAVGFAFGSIWGQVATYTDLGNDSEGRGHQSWTFTLRSGATAQLVKAGNIAVDFGASGQGYVHLSTLESADGPWIQIGEWNGSDPYTPGNRTIGTQVGSLDNISDTALNPAGYGLYSDNAYLRGMLRTAETIMDDDGLALLHSTATGSGDFDTAHARITWWPDLDNQVGDPRAELTSWRSAAGTPTANRLNLLVYDDDTVDSASITIAAIGATGVLIHLDTYFEHIRFDGTTQFIGNAEPSVDLTYNLGSASLRWASIYADQLVISGTVSGAILGGQEWQYSGSMIIDANSAGSTTVSVTNQGAGSANLAVDNNITLGGTVDGVDISAHDADASAHHDPVTAGDGIGLSGQQVAVNSTVARNTWAVGAGAGMTGGGNLASAGITLNVIGGDGITVNANDVALASTTAGAGLTYTTGVLAVGSGDGMTVNANDVALASTVAGAGLTFTTGVVAVGSGDGIVVAADSVAVDLATNSGLLFSGGDLALGTPSLLTTTSTGSVTTSVHAHAIDHSSDPGAAAKILSSTSSGGLTLQTLGVEGNLDVTNGGDFTVGANVLFVDNSGENVGIMRAPDPQFALDVNGPIRGTELVGQHAIQLQDVALLLHYDGGGPYTTNYTGEPNAIPLGQVPTVNNVVIYRPGKFYKAATFGRAATNSITNPSFEVTTTGWNIFNAGSGNLAATRVTDEAWVGSACAKLTWTTLDTSQFYNNPVASSSGGAYSFSVWMRSAVACTVTIYIQRNDSPFTIYASKACAVTEEWQHFCVEATPAAGVPLRGNIIPAGAANSVWVDATQFETGEVTWYIDGTLGGNSSSGTPDGTGYAWTGTAHASSSTRATGSRLHYTFSTLVYHRWTLMLWLKFPAAADATNAGYFTLTMFNGDQIDFYHTSGAKWLHYEISSAHSFNSIIPTPLADTWYHIALSYTPGALAVYVNGALVNTYAKTFSSAPGSLSVGYASYTASSGNVMIDDVVVSKQALSAERILAIYESDAPVFAESSVFHFRATPKGLVWADEEGLWMRDTSGNPVLGAYGGDSTKSWGGFTLEPGDILFGRYGASDGGWLRFDRDGVSSLPYLSLGYANNTVFALDSGGATLNGVLDLGTNGGLYQGTGTFASPTTGLKIFNQSGVGRIAGFDGGVNQWNVSTTGRLVAGAGNVILDANGISIVAGENPYNSIEWTNGGVQSLRLYNASDASYNVGRFHVTPITSRISLAVIRANSPASTGARIDLEAQTNSVDTVNLRLNSAASSGGVTITQDSATGAQAVLGLIQDDADQPMIYFTGQSGATTSFSINTAAVGTYRGKIQVVINGTTRWIPFYD